MARTTVFPLYDRILDGRLAEILRDLSADRTPPQVRDELRDRHGVDVSVATVRRWLADLATEAAS